MGEKNCHKKFILQLKEKPNRAHPIPEYVKNRILEEMQRLRTLHITHVYKYTCETTLKQKYCNAVMVKKKKGTTNSFQYMKGDVITEKWLYDTAVGLHGCQDWYDSVVDKRVTNKVFELPVAAVANTDVKPPRDMDVPELQYTQDGVGTCGISALSSAFHHMFDQDLAGLIISRKEGYMKSLSEPIVGKSKKPLL